MTTLLPGTEVHARRLPWVVAHTEDMGQQTLLRLRGAEGAVSGLEFDLLTPFEEVEAVITHGNLTPAVIYQTGSGSPTNDPSGPIKKRA
ncbi:MAG: hypothetical protein NTW21_13055 [Verrucomicrobia bacterium]|nr:hypothetical protein [Verrucomicrobiota bacterium]